MKQIYFMLLLSITSSLWTMNNPMSISAICNDQDEDVAVQLAKEDAAIILSDIRKDSYKYIGLFIQAEIEEYTNIRRKIVVPKRTSKCSLCNSYLSDKQSVYAHAVRWHDACLECEIQFSSEEIIILHMMRRHFGKKKLIDERIEKIKNPTIKNILQEIMAKH